MLSDSEASTVTLKKHAIKILHCVQDDKLYNIQSPQSTTHQ